MSLSATRTSRRTDFPSAISLTSTASGSPTIERMIFSTASFTSVIQPAVPQARVPPRQWVLPQQEPPREPFPRPEQPQQQQGLPRRGQPERLVFPPRPAPLPQQEQLPVPE